MERTEQQIREKILKLILSKKIERLEFPGSIITKKNVFSLDYSNCNGVIILGKEFLALSHYSSDVKKSQEYLPNMIQEIKTKEEGKLVGILIGGDEQHFNKNREILKDYNIPIVSEYCDGMNDFPIKPWTIFQGNKDLFIDNYHKEVFLGTNWGIQQIWPVK